jgi:hypothetical protein
MQSIPVLDSKIFPHAISISRNWDLMETPDSLASHSLNLRLPVPSRGFPSRSILDFARDDNSKTLVFEMALAL